MITPLQSAAASISTTLMKSILESSEQRRAEDEKKKTGISSQDDEMLKAKIDASAARDARNDKINAHVFSSLANEESPISRLAARLTDALKIRRQEGELITDFGQRVKDALFFVERIGLAEAQDVVKGGVKYGFPSTDKITLKRFQVSAEDLRAAQDGSNPKPSANTLAILRFMKANDVAQGENEEDDDFSGRIGYKFAEYRVTLGESIMDIERISGLRELGISAADMAQAIQEPYGAMAKAIEKKLDEKAKNERDTLREMKRAVQRLDDVTDVKSKAELILERDGPKDPTKLEDDQTRAEREKDIRDREAGEKLKDVQKVQDAVGALNEAAQKDATAPADGEGGETNSSEGGAAAIDLLTTLAAGAQAVKTTASAEATAGSTPTTAQAETPDTEKSDAELENEQLTLVATAGKSESVTGDQDGDADTAILAISVDEIGIYDLIKRKANATEAVDGSAGSATAEATSSKAA